jgi:hypothetical protein
MVLNFKRFKDQTRQHTARGSVARNFFTVFHILLSVMVAASQAPAQQQAPTDFSAILASLDRHFASLDGYEPGDLLCQSQIEAALQAVRKAGWAVADPQRISKLGLADGSFLVKELSTPSGKKFMRKIARHAGGYARLDRLSSISRGERIVRDLIRQRDGDKFIEYLATTSGGHKLGGKLAGAERGVDLNKPTGRIYTAEDFIAVLQHEYTNYAVNR